MPRAPFRAVPALLLSLLILPSALPAFALPAAEPVTGASTSPPPDGSAPRPAPLPPPRPESFGDAALVAEVRAAETAFAKTMADRDLDAFAGYIADDAIFVNGTYPLNGKPAILAVWGTYFDGPAPFSWTPETVVVLGSGTLAQSKGPVMGPDGSVVAEFRSTWRRGPDGRWQVVFDDGACRCARPAAE